MRPLRLLAALAGARMWSCPGFSASAPGGTIVSLGRGGSDLTAVLLAIALRADGCELVKDVAGLLHGRPARRSRRRPAFTTLPIDDALAMADEGCDLVQRAALAAAAQRRLFNHVVRSLDAAAPPVTCMFSQGVPLMEFATKTIHAGQPSEPETGSLIAPIFQTSTYEQEAPGQSTAASTTRGRTIRRGPGSKPCSRSSKASSHCAIFGSGLAAENAVLQAYLQARATRSSFRSTSTAARIGS